MKRAAVLLISILFSIGCTTTRKYQPAIEGDHFSLDTIYVGKHGWHTTIIIARSALDSLFPELGQKYPDDQFVEISWGDKRYFMAPDDDVFLAIRAALIPTKSVIRVVGLPHSPLRYYAPKTIHPIKIRNDHLSDLVNYIQSDFAKTDSMTLVNIGSSKRYYLSETKYWGLRTCNTWVAKALKAGRFPIKPIFSVTSGQVYKKVKKKSIE
jgi:uncharacterized protein (TIGR02117 family)